MKDVRSAIESQVRQLMGTGPAADLQDPGDDVGLFGPNSVCWRVHGDFPAMMIGGISALLLQMLHPGALAGVWDHSNFRQDMTGRLRRTAQFVAGTTYGSTTRAAGLIDKVRSIHDQVSGTLPDGGAYSANDPALLTWVHVAEMSSFLRAYVRHRDPSLSHADQDRYLAETAVIAERLGATNVPRSRAEVETYLSRMRPRLRADERTREVVRILRDHPAPNLASAPFARLFFEAGAALLPDWAARMHGLRIPQHRRPAIGLGVRGVGATLRWALRDGAEARARRRAAALADQARA